MLSSYWQAANKYLCLRVSTQWLNEYTSAKFPNPYPLNRRFIHGKVMVKDQSFTTQSTTVPKFNIQRYMVCSNSFSRVALRNRISNRMHDSWANVLLIDKCVTNMNAICLCYSVQIWDTTKMHLQVSNKTAIVHIYRNFCHRTINYDLNQDTWCQKGNSITAGLLPRLHSVSQKFRIADLRFWELIPM